MKKVLLINPSWIITNKKNLWSKIGSCWPSLSLLTIASVLKKRGHKVYYLDMTSEELTANDLKEREFDYDFVGITATTNIAPSAYKSAEIIKVINPKAKIILGGIHPTILPEEALEKHYIDFVVRDEGEETIIELIEGKELKSIKGLSYKKHGKIVHNQPRGVVEDLDSLPFPAYELLDFKKFRPAVGTYKRLPAMMILVTRGCPNLCSFCYHGKGAPRTKSAERIIEEIKLLRYNYGIEELAFYDDSFSLFRDNITKVCDLIIEHKIDITWSCFSRVNYVSFELLKKMKEAGCHLILFGVESGDEEMLKRIKKGINLEQVKKAVKWCNELKLEVRCSFMFGNQGETEETVKKTIKFALSLDIDEFQGNIATPYPGTEFYDWADKNGYLLTKDWNDYVMSEAIVELPTISREKLRYYNKLAHRKFYLRPKVILRRLFKIRTIEQLKQEVKGALAVLGF